MPLQLQDLMNAAQRAGVSGAGAATGGGQVAPVSPMTGGNPLVALQALGGGGGGAPPMAPSVPVDPQQQLMQLLQGAAQGPQGGATLQAISQLMAGAGGNGGGGGPLDMAASRGIPPNPNMPNLNNGSDSTGPATDSDLTEMVDASDSVRKDLPPAKRDAYTGDDGENDPINDGGRLQNDTRVGPTDRQSGYTKYKNPDQDDNDPEQWQGQRNMGAYLNAKKPMSTEEELADVQNKMGGESGPDPAHVNALNRGQMSEQAFEKMYGKGSAAKHMNEDDDEGDHEYR